MDLKPAFIKNMNLNNLYKIIEKRKKEMPQDSYVASLFSGSEDKILQKLGEEAIEVVIAAKNTNKKELISEISDLWFRICILMVEKNITFSDIEKELEKRDSRK